LQRTTPETGGIDNELEWQIIDAHLIVRDPYAVNPNTVLIGITLKPAYLYLAPAAQHAGRFLLARVGYRKGRHATVR
jgi:hypothetical protein